MNKTDPIEGITKQQIIKAKQLVGLEVLKMSRGLFEQLRQPHRYGCGEAMDQIKQDAVAMVVLPGKPHPSEPYGQIVHVICYDTQALYRYVGGDPNTFPPDLQWLLDLPQIFVE